MKLVIVFMLAIIPVYCRTNSSGCNALDDAIAKTINSSVSMEEYHETVQKYTFLPYIRRTMEKFKECFAKQSNETQHNVFVMEFAIYNSDKCSGY
ncbi:secretoglobin family 2A member 1-like [Mesocricetus auratus]|uniref:Heteroglobin B1 subunit n=1 Tax=Mesocricetus auratus TaxID=10036 RepID=Q9QXF3_MESAU|nr:secretoglobin family 2A member 1-like [Mesocricetus auratus]ATV94958.1 heteroglobin b1 subunit [Mesocricetus auratus]CAB64660.1 heteroglobin B1 subunit [Mesocricetus auratus]